MDTEDVVKLASLTVPQSLRYDKLIFNPPADDPWPLTMEPRARNETTSLGRLDRLPLEILHMVSRSISYLDAINLGRTNSAATSVLLSLPEYKNLTQHAPEILNGLQITELAQHFTLLQVYNVLTSSRCTFCRRFGGYVSLPSLQRCCVACGEHHIELMPISRNVARRDFGVDRKTIKTLPQMHTVRGVYGTSDGRTHFYVKDLVLVSQDVARSNGCRTQHEKTIFANDMSRVSQRHMAIAPMAYLNLKSGKTETGLRCKACVTAFGEHYNCGGTCNEGRFHEGEWLFLAQCHGTFFKDDPSLKWSLERDMSLCPNGIACDRLYSSTDFGNHFEECTGAQKLWDLERNAETTTYSY